MVWLRSFLSLLPNKSLALLQQVVDWLWGYDFFISYHWATGGQYATSLAQQLQQHFDVFLDRAEYAAGEDWLIEGRRALDRSRSVILIATTVAVRDSVPVRKEVEYFAEKSASSIIPIVFDGDEFPNDPGLLALIPPYVLHIREESGCLLSGPSRRTLQSIHQRSAIFRRRRVRQLIAGITMSVVLVVAGVAYIANQRQQLAEYATAFAEAGGRLSQTADRVAFSDPPGELAIAFVNELSRGKVTCRLTKEVRSIDAPLLKRLCGIDRLSVLLLELDGCELAQGALCQLTAAQQLQTLIMKDLPSENRHRVGILRDIGQLQHLKRLAIINCSLKTADIVPLADLPVESLAVCVNALDEQSWNTFSKMRELKRLFVDSNLPIFAGAVPDATTKGFSQLTHLFLTQQYQALGDHGAKFIRNLPNLNHVFLQDTELSPGQFGLLCSAVKLQTVSLNSGSGLTASQIVDTLRVRNRSPILRVDDDLRQGIQELPRHQVRTELELPHDVLSVDGILNLMIADAFLFIP